MEAHPHYGITLNFITVYPGTKLYEFAVNNQIIKDPVRFLKDGCPTINVSKMSEDGRAWLSRQIVELPQALLEAPDKIEDLKIDFDNAYISFSGLCRSCNRKNRWHSIRFFTRNVLSCKYCGRKHKVPVAESMIRQMDKHISELLIQYKKIAFWGINDYFGDLCGHIDSIAASEKIFFVDVSQMKQGTRISGKLIQSPDIIEAENIRMVVVPVISFYNTITQQAKERYACIESVISILDLTRNTSVKGDLR